MKRSMGFWRSWALVVGIMIGNGIFLLPSVLAPYGSMSLLGWLFAGGGTLFIVLMLASLAARIPKLGGPYAYTREAFGDLPGFLVAWGYWISIWSAVAAGAVAVTGYAGFFLPWLTDKPQYSGISSLIVIWTLTSINTCGVKSASIFQLVTTLMKLVPLFFIAGCGLLLGDVSEIPASNPEQQTYPVLVASMVMLIMWAFVGVEGVTIPADDVIDPERTIPMALVAGTLTVTIVYISATYGVMALVPARELAQSTSPFADAASLLLGPWGARLVAFGALISIIGSLNGNILVGGMIARAIAVDNLFPQKFGQLNQSGAPAFSLVCAGLLSSLLIVMNYSKGLMGAFELLILLSTLTTLLPYMASALAEIYLRLRDYRDEKLMPASSVVIAMAALAFTTFTIIGSGADVILYGVVLLTCGLPVYFLGSKYRARNQ